MKGIQRWSEKLGDKVGKGGQVEVGNSCRVGDKTTSKIVI